MIARTLAVSALCVALGGLFAPAAHADATDFLTDVHALGWYAGHGDAGLLANGYQVCRMLNNMNGTVVAQYVYDNTGASVTRADAVEFVMIAVADLCPWHDHSNQGQVA